MPLKIRTVVQASDGLTHRTPNWPIYEGSRLSLYPAVFVDIKPLAGCGERFSEQRRGRGGCMKPSFRRFLSAWQPQIPPLEAHPGSDRSTSTTTH